MNFRLLALLFTLGTLPLTAADWQTTPPASLQAKPKAGKNLQSVKSPDGRSVFLVRDEGEQGDFIWSTIYVKQGDDYTQLGTFNEVSKIAWSNDSATVTFQTSKAVDSNLVQILAAEYTPATQTFKTRLLRTEKIEI